MPQELKESSDNQKTKNEPESDRVVCLAQNGGQKAL